MRYIFGLLCFGFGVFGSLYAMMVFSSLLFVLAICTVVYGAYLIASGIISE